LLASEDMGSLRLIVRFQAIVTRMGRSAIHPLNIMIYWHTGYGEFGRVKMSEYSRFGHPLSPATEAKRSERHPLFGALKDVTFVLPGIDLTEPANPDWGEVYERTAVVPAKRSASRDS
jgi:hypothetical protein